MTALDPAFLSVPLAHRALHDASAGRPENGPSAVRAALEAGYGIEIDVQLTSDGRAAVFHDGGLDRLTAETGPVRDRTMAALVGLMAGSLRALWPWQPWDSPERVLLWPQQGDPVTSVLLLTAAGFAFVAILTWWGSRRIADSSPA